MGKISTSPKYIIEITGTDPLSLGELGGGRINPKTLKKEVFLTYEEMIGSL